MPQPFPANPEPQHPKILERIKGCLEVQAINDTFPGCLVDLYIPVGAIGYVIAAKDGQDGQYCIIWPSHLDPVPPSKQTVWGSHPVSDVKPTGRRG